jgi:hypothetical protein
VYYSNGHLKREVRYKENAEDGPCYQFYENGQLWSAGDMSGGYPQKGIQFSFFKDGAISQVSFIDDLGQCAGPLVRYMPDGGLNGDVEYLIHSRSYSREIYEKAAAKDSTLPRIERDPKAYKKLLEEKTKKIIAQYKAMPPVKIPLECKDEKKRRSDEFTETDDAAINRNIEKLIQERVAELEKKKGEEDGGDKGPSGK